MHPVALGIGMNSSPGGGLGMVANPPYIRFEVKAVERRKSVEEGGEVFYVDTVFAHVTSHGSKDTVTKVAKEWFVQLKEDVRQGRFPQQWLDAYLATFKAWENDQEPPVIGTSIKNWPAASPAEIKHCNGFGIRSVEDLATANEELIGRLGMGGRALCQRAKDWVQGSKDSAPLVQQLAAVRAENEGLKFQLAAANDRARIAETQLRDRPQAVGQVAQLLPVFAPLESRLQSARDEAPEVDETDLIGNAVSESLGDPI